MSQSQYGGRPTIHATASSPRPSAQGLLDQVIAATAHSGFDADAWHVMNERDNALIADEVLAGSGSSKFVYNFAIAGTTVTGISVIGARHLAAAYGGIKHRMIASTLKRGALFIFTTYPADGNAMSVRVEKIEELRDEPDYYSALIEITDVKKGNTVQNEATEFRLEKRRDGSYYERPHFQKIAQAKAFRNGVLSVIPQDVQLAWKEEMLKLHKDDIITESVISQKRAGVLRFSAAKGLSIDRHAVEALTLDQIAGLADAARGGDLALFIGAAGALGLMAVREAGEAETPHDPETGEIIDEKPKAAGKGKGKAPPDGKGKVALTPREPQRAPQPADEPPPPEDEPPPADQEVLPPEPQREQPKAAAKPASADPGPAPADDEDMFT